MRILLLNDLLDPRIKSEEDKVWDTGEIELIKARLRTVLSPGAKRAVYDMAAEKDFVHTSEDSALSVIEEWYCQ